MNATNDPLLQAALDAALAAARGAAGGPPANGAPAATAVPVAPVAQPLAAPRLALCRECQHFRADAEGDPLDPPCRLHGWRPCQWKRQAANAAPAIKAGCLWANTKEAKDHA